MGIISTTLNGNGKKVKITADSDPSAADDVNSNFIVGCLWQNLKSGKNFVCGANPPSTAIWSVVSTSALLNKYDAVANPSVNDDFNAGYSIGSRWINVLTATIYTLINGTVGAAVWSEEEVGGPGSTLITAIGSNPIPQLAALFGPTATEGMSVRVLDEVVACNAINNPLSNVIPAFSAIMAILTNAQTLLTGGGTTVGHGVRAPGEGDYVNNATLAKNSKCNWVDDANSHLSADATFEVYASEAGGGVGNTALVGSVRVVIVYFGFEPLANVP